MERFDRSKAKQLIKKRGRTRPWIAEQCGIAVRSLSNILNGKTPSCRVVKLLAMALECDASDLYLSPPQKPRKGKLEVA